MADGYEDEIATCMECHSDQPFQYIVRNIFFQQGGAIPCKFCSGIVAIMKREDRDAVLKRTDQKRGVSPKPEDDE